MPLDSDSLIIFLPFREQLQPQNLNPPKIFGPQLFEALKKWNSHFLPSFGQSLHHHRQDFNLGLRHEREM